MTFSDEELVERILLGDQSCFELLVSRYQKKIYSFIYRTVTSEEDARDLTQEVFILAFRALGMFRREAQFNTWLYRIASNKTVDFLRKHKKFCFSEQAVEEVSASSLNSLTLPNDPEQIYLRDEKIRRLRRQMAGLPDRYREVLVLFHFEEMTYQQIADILELPVKTVATRLYRGKLVLKERLRGETDGMLEN